MKKLLQLLMGTFIATLLLSCISLAADTRGLIIEGRTLVPVRGVFEELGFNVIWDADTQTAFLADNNYTVKIQKGATTFTTNSEIITPEVPQQVISDSFYLPLRAIADSIGAETEWDNNNKVATIHYNNKIAFVFCGDVTSDDYFTEDNLNSENEEYFLDYIETTTETTTEVEIGVQSIRDISVERDDDQNLSVSFLPDELHDYSQKSEKVNIYLYNKLEKLIYQDTISVNIADNNDYIDFEIRYNNLKSAVSEGDLKSYTHCVLKLELLANDEVYATGEYTFGVMINYQNSFSNSQYDITVNAIETKTDMKNNIIVRFKIIDDARVSPLYFTSVYFISYDFAGNQLDSTKAIISPGSTFEQDYTFPGNTAYITIQAH